MNANDEELQKAAESGEKTMTDNLDGAAYQAVFRALKKDPGYQLSARFTERVVARITRQQESNNSKDYIWLGAGIFLLLVAFVGTILFTEVSLDLEFLSVISDYKGPAVFGILLIVLLNWLDKRLIRGRLMRHD